MIPRGLYWDELRAVIRDNAAPSTHICYYYDPKGDPLNIAVFDRSLPRRKAERYAETGAPQYDHWRDSQVCRAAFHGGMIPLHNGTVSNDGSKFSGQVYRGAIGLLETLLSEGCLRRTDDLRRMFREWGRELPAVS